MCDCFHRLEDSNNYSAGVLPTTIAKNTSYIAGRGVESQMLYIIITAVMSSTLWWPLYALFYCSTLYRLEVMSQCCNNLSYIFIHTYFHYQASKAKLMVRQMVEPVVNVTFRLDTIVWYFWPLTLLAPIIQQKDSFCWLVKPTK